MVLLLAKNCAAVVQGLVVEVVVVEDTGGGGGIWRCMVVVVVAAVFVCVVGVRLRDVSIQVVWGMVVVVVDDEEACDDATAADPNTDPHAVFWRRTGGDGTIIKGAGWGRFCSDCTGVNDDDDDQQ
jgi:hypothetical protein